MSKCYDELVERISKEVEHILHEAERSQGVQIEITMGVGDVPVVSYTIKEKVV